MMVYVAEEQGSGERAVMRNALGRKACHKITHVSLAVSPDIATNT